METNACNLVALTTDPSATCDALTHGLKVLGEGSMKAGLFRFGELNKLEGFGTGFYYGVEQGVEGGRYEGIAISFGIVTALALSYGACKVIASRLAARKLVASAKEQLETAVEILNGQIDYVQEDQENEPEETSEEGEKGGEE